MENDFFIISVDLNQINTFDENYKTNCPHYHSTHDKLEKALKTIIKDGKLSKNENRLNDVNLYEIISITSQSNNSKYNVEKASGKPEEVAQEIQNIISKNQDSIILIPSETYKFGFYHSNHFVLAKYIAEESKLYFYDSKGKDISNYVEHTQFKNSNNENVTIQQQNSLIQIDSNACGYVSFLNTLPDLIKDKTFLQQYFPLTHTAKESSNNGLLNLLYEIFILLGLMDPNQTLIEETKNSMTLMPNENNEDGFLEIETNKDSNINPSYKNEITNAIKLLQFMNEIKVCKETTIITYNHEKKTNKTTQDVLLSLDDQEQLKNLLIEYLKNDLEEFPRKEIQDIYKNWLGDPNKNLDDIQEQAFLNITRPKL